MTDGPDKGGLVFLYRETADIKHLQGTGRVQIVFRRDFRADAGIRDHAIGDNMEFGLEVVTFKPITDILSGALQMRAMIENKISPGIDKQIVRDFAPAKSQGAENILRMQVVGSGYGFSQPSGYPACSRFKYHGLFHVNHIGPAHGLFDNLLVCGSEIITLCINDGLKNRKIKPLELVIRFRAVGVTVRS